MYPEEDEVVLEPNALLESWGTSSVEYEVPFYIYYPDLRSSACFKFACNILLWGMRHVKGNGGLGRC